MSFMAIIGLVFTVAAYLLSSLGKIKPTGLLYAIFNIVGTVGVGYDNLAHHAYAGLCLNAIWGLVAIYVAIKYLVNGPPPEYDPFPTKPHNRDGYMGSPLLPPPSDDD